MLRKPHLTAEFAITFPRQDSLRENAALDLALSGCNRQDRILLPAIDLVGNFQGTPPSVMSLGVVTLRAMIGTFPIEARTPRMTLQHRLDTNDLDTLVLFALEKDTMKGRLIAHHVQVRESELHIGRFHV